MKLLFLSLFISSLSFAQSGLSGNYLNLTPTTLPTYCSQGEFRFSAGSSTFQGCAATNTWSSVGGSSLPITTTGDMIYSSSGSTAARLGIGASGSVLSVSGGIPSWQPFATPSYPISLSNGGTGVSAGSSTAAFNALSPLSASGDLLYENSSLNPVRLGIGSSSSVLTVNSGSPSWQALPTPYPTPVYPIALNQGGTGIAAGSSTAAFNALSPMSTSGDITYENSSLSPVRLGIGSSNNSLLVSSGIPAWGPVPLASSGAVSGQLPLGNGGTSVNAGSTTALFSALSPTTAGGDILYQNAADNGLTRLGIGASNNSLLVSSGIPAWGAVPLASAGAVSGQLPLANGGTSINAGSTTALYSALSPMTTRGDIEYENTGATGVARLGIGTTSQALITSSGLPAWGTLPLLGGGTGVAAGSSIAALNGIWPMTGIGDLVYGGTNPTGQATRLGIGSSGSVLTVSGGIPSWGTAALTDPMTTTGDMIYSSSGSTPARLGIGSSASVLTVSGGLPVWSTPTSGSTITYASAYMAEASSWSTTSASFADPTNAGGNALTVRKSNNLTLTAESLSGNSLPAIVFTPASAASVYLVMATFGLHNNNGGDGALAQLIDNNSTVIASPAQWDEDQNAFSAYVPTISGIYAPATTSPVTIRIQLLAGGGTAALSGASGSAVASIEWTVIQINPPANGTIALASGVSGVLPLANGGTNVAAGSTTAAFNALSPMSTSGDLIYENSSLNPVRLGIQANGSVLGIVGGAPAWTNNTIAARYHGSTNTILASMSVISFNTQDFDSNSAYTAHTAANGFFTVPATGYYSYNVSLNMTDATLAAGNIAQMDVVYVLSGTSTIMATSEQVGAAATAKPLQLMISDLYYMISGATVYVEVKLQGTTPSITSSNFLNYFSIGLEH